MIGRLVPAGAVGAEAFDDALPGLPDPRELALVRGRPDRVVRQFTAARACAHRCLDALGAPAGPLLRTADGVPVWPSGFVGSITHCAGYRAAVAAPADRWAALGVDAEPALPLPHGVLGLVASEPERRMVARLTAGHSRLPWDRLLFSAKEAVYKAWYPATRRWIGTAAVEIAFTADGLLTAEIRPGRTAAPPVPVPAGWPAGDGEPAAARCTGRWQVAEGFVLTAVAVPAAAG
ncbi:4'-phosphopantetheinyl transferase superfamily protein [Streptomyces sp. NBC_01754]|uniref:4'-phosphopantetheinyl transferase family protein n=1 Tax=Streptomyces sp. NBC_01754 TaxID=2975930 RepID=UPI002DDC5483|nr:4'-phosphopantetheinyl transferase superfamily protein [Streptomyces sp. NBC_01754]WSC95312.1 4'-phosphopantetheinyl transferase superfamily protein [Streptomyces sp. NBC_01754]